MKESVRKKVLGFIDFYQLDCDVDEFIDHANWDDISRREDLSKDFIVEYKNQLNWGLLSSYSFDKLSENLIREFKDKVDWYGIEHCQNVSMAFKREFKEEVVQWKYYFEDLDKENEKIKYRNKDLLKNKLKDRKNMELITINQSVRTKGVVRHIKITQTYFTQTNRGNYQYTIFDSTKNNILKVGSSGGLGIEGKIDVTLALEIFAMERSLT